MDSLTHIALGAAIGTAVLGRKAGAKAALWGAVCSTLPDLDVLIPYGDPVRDFTFHRGHSHSLFWLALLAPLLALLAVRLHRGLQASYREWVTLMGLTLLAHPVLDAFTVYGTQLLLPFTDYPAGSGSIFIIDPLYTLPIVGGLIAYWRLRGRAEPRAHRWNVAGIAASTLYLAWSVGAQAHVEGIVERTLAATPAGSGRVLVTPTPFNTLLWRVVVMGDGGYREGFYSLLDRTGRVTLAWHASDGALLEGLRDEWSVQRLAWFAKGFYSVERAAPDALVARDSAGTLAQLLGAVPTAQAADASAGDNRPRIVVSDLRMGQTPWFVFNFVVGALDGHVAAPLPSQQLPSERPPVQVLTWLWQRIWDERAGPPPTA